MKSLIALLVIVGVIGYQRAIAQCSGSGSQTTYGSGSWIGYVYSGQNNFNAANYKGRITQSQNFDTSFCNGQNCDFSTNTCTITANYFTVRFRMTQNFANGIYRITLGGDDGVRLSLDGGSSYVLQDYSAHSYRTQYVEMRLSGSYNMILDYYEIDGDSRVSLNIEYLGTNWGGTVASDQSICESSSSVDPEAFTSVTVAQFSNGGSPTYRWQSSTDNSNWANIPGANSSTYDIPAGFSDPIRYYRRRATNSGNTVYSNTLAVTYAQSQGDQISYGDNSWIGYVYDGVNNFSSDYIGEVFEAETFYEDFGGSYNIFSTSGCDLYAETFSTRFLMTKFFAYGEYSFTIGGDDGVRLSLDGGSTWLIDDYTDHGYRTVTSSTVILDGSYNLVLEFYENGGANEVMFDYDLVIALPVTYVSFTAVQTNNGNFLQWITASEDNNDYFGVERTYDGEEWGVIGLVAGNGTSKVQQSYSFLDADSKSEGPIYYRLKQVDYDGRYEYSDIIRLVTSNSITSTRLSLYPNPASTRVSLDWDGYIVDHVELMNLIGGVVKTFSSKKLDISDIPPGIYLVKAIDRNGKTAMTKVIVK